MPLRPGQRLNHLCIIFLLVTVAPRAQTLPTPGTYRFVLVPAGSNPDTTPPVVPKAVSPADVRCDVAPSTETVASPYEAKGGLRLEFDDPVKPDRRCTVVVAIGTTCDAKPCPLLDGYLSTETRGVRSAWVKATPPLTLALSSRVACVVSAWPPWSGWSAWVPAGPVDKRTRTQKRAIVTRPTNGGADCPALVNPETETRPTTVPAAPGTSPDGTRIPPAPSIKSRVGDLWTLDGTRTLKNGAWFSNGSAKALTYCGDVVRILGTDGAWWRVDVDGLTGSKWQRLEGPDPCAAGRPPPPPPLP